MNTNKIGTLGELKVAEEFIKADYSVFTQLSGKEPFDLIAYKDGTTLKVQVKSTSVRGKYGRFFIMLQTCRPNRTGTTIKKFDNTTVDILAVYLQELDTVCYFKASEVLVKRGLTLCEKPSKFANRSNVISDFTDLSNAIP